MGLAKLTVHMPMGLGDGIVGANVLAAKWQLRKRPGAPFRAIVLMPAPMIGEAELAYRRAGGDGMVVLRVEAGPRGSDQVAEALTRCRGLALLTSFENARFVKMAFKRMQMEFVDFAVFEMAHLALQSGSPAREAVFEWDKLMQLELLEALFITARAMEVAPVKGLGNATKEVPGIRPYRVVSRKGGRCGPEVFTMDAAEARMRGITVPVRLVPLDIETPSLASTAAGLELAPLLARLHDALGLRAIEALPADGEAVAPLGQEVRRLTRGLCAFGVARTGAAEPGEGPISFRGAESEALLVHGDFPSVDAIAQALGRASFRTHEKPALYVLLPWRAPAAAAVWAALAAHDVRVELALKEAAVARGGAPMGLGWDQLPNRLQDLFVRSGEQTDEEQHRAWVAQAVNRAIDQTADAWDEWYGRLLEYRRTRCENDEAAFEVPLDASIHGHEIGRWVAKQFMEWRWGLLDIKKQQLLMDAGLTIQEEIDRKFERGLEEFERHLQDQNGDPHIHPGHIVGKTGFPLWSWSLSQRAAWRTGRLSAEKQYLLDATGFPPVAHPVDEAARQVTLRLERSLRDASRKDLEAREQVFRHLVLSHHPSYTRAAWSQAATHFLAGYRSWFLNPPEPPIGAGKFEQNRGRLAR